MNAFQISQQFFQMKTVSSYESFVQNNLVLDFQVNFLEVASDLSLCWNIFDLRHGCQLNRTMKTEIRKLQSRHNRSAEDCREKLFGSVQ